MTKHGLNDQPEYRADNTYLKRVEFNKQGKEIHIWGITKQDQPGASELPKMSEMLVTK